MPTLRKTFLPVLGLAVLLSLSFTNPIPSVNEGKLKTIIIDAGHGGKDPGASGTKAREKDVTLAIALKLEEVLKEKMPDLNVILTRSEDEFIELHNRAKHAYGNEADFFISIHCNSNNNTKAHGTETYVMGLHKEDANLNMIMNENKAILLEENHEEEYDGFDPTSAASYILFSLVQNAFIKQSSSLAKKIEAEFVDDGRHSRGVKQAGFLVLWKAGTPSILIETGFISNKEEEEFLNSETGQQHIANSIYAAVESYSLELD